VELVIAFTYKRFRLDLGKQSDMIVFEALLTGIEERCIFKAEKPKVKIGQSLFRKTVQVHSNTEVYSSFASIYINLFIADI